MRSAVGVGIGTLVAATTCELVQGRVGVGAIVGSGVGLAGAHATSRQASQMYAQNLFDDKRAHLCQTVGDVNA